MGVERDGDIETACSERFLNLKRWKVNYEKNKVLIRLNKLKSILLIKNCVS